MITKNEVAEKTLPRRKNNKKRKKRYTEIECDNGRCLNIFKFVVDMKNEKRNEIWTEEKAEIIY